MNKCVVMVTHSNELAKQADVIFKLRKGSVQIFERMQDGISAHSDSEKEKLP